MVIGQQLRSLVTADGALELSMVAVEVPEPRPDEVVIRVEAAPINPSDIGLLLVGADLSTASASGTPEQPVIRAQIPAPAFRAAAGRLGQSLPVGNEGAGAVIEAGSSDRAQSLAGRTVAVSGGGMGAAGTSFSPPDSLHPWRSADYPSSSRKAATSHAERRFAHLTWEHRQDVP